MFTLGQIAATPAALEQLSPRDVFMMLRRHSHMDWGDVPVEDANANRRAVDSGERVISAYTINGTRFWVITEADRRVTTILLPEEY